MACNPCCCFSLKDSAVMIGIWTLVYSIASLFLFGWQTGVLNHCRTVTMSQANLQCEWDCPCVGASNARTTRIIFSIAQLGIMGWQMAAIKYEKDRAANTLLPNYNTYGKYDIPSYYESYWQSPEERYYTDTVSDSGILPTFRLSSAYLWSSHAYCIMWWAGDVRDYWMALTILEIIAVFINVYCVVVIYMFMKRLSATTDEYEGKQPKVRYKINRSGYTRRSLDGYHALHEPYPPRRPMGTPQISPSTQPQKYPSTPPYPVDPIERIQYDQEPKARSVEKDDHVAHWVKDQQLIALLSERGDANSEPISSAKIIHDTVVSCVSSLQHSRSVPSLYDGTLVSHRSCRHGKHRSSSRRRSRSRHVRNSSDSESPIEFAHERRRRRRSRTHYTDSDVTDTTDRWDREDYMQRRRGSRNSHHRKDRGDRRMRKENHEERRRHEREKRHDKDDTTIERGLRRRERREEQRGEEAERVPERAEKE
uniref:Anoctamin n=1 Tax=Angiostrongylus cantonensis TaxID=6313 RepID=A0A0K0CUG8_ANGCA